ncbi:SGNH/GDSL hydrolase family protein [Agrobacterium vitis]
MTISPNGASIWVDGPSTSVYHPPKSMIRQWAAVIEAALNALTTGAGSIAKDTRANLYADLSFAAGTMAWVYDDATAAYNGIYVKSGASESGSWTRILSLPYSYVVATDTGTGTANAIKATTDIPVSEDMLIMLDLLSATTGEPATISFNDGIDLTIKTNRGADASALTAGMLIVGKISGSTFRLVTDEDVSALVDQAGEARDAAAAAAAAAIAAAEAAAASRYEIIPSLSEFGMLPSASAATNIAAIAAAVAHRDSTGKETFYLPSGTYNVTGVGADIHKIILTGPGKLTGVYRKNVIDQGGRKDFLPGITFDAPRHLKNFMRKTSPVVVLIGDSLTGEDSFTTSDMHNGIDPMIRQLLAESFPKKNVTFYNRGIGGARWADLDGVWAGTMPAWYTNTAATWLSYIDALKPDAIFISFGMNDGYSYNSGNFSGQIMGSVLDKIKGWTKETDIVFLTNMVPSLISTNETVAGETQMEGRDAIAGITRSFAQMGGYGYFDINRWFNVVRDGQDVLDCRFTPSVSATQAIPYLPSTKCRDYIMQASFTSITSTFWDINGNGSSVLRIKLSNGSNNFATIVNEGGYLRLNVYADSNCLYHIQKTAIPTPATGTNVVILIRVKGNTLLVRVNGLTLYDGPVLRFGGIFAPEFRYSSNEAGMSGTFTLQTGVDSLYLPKMTDAQMYGYAPYTDDGGNQINHPTFAGYDLISQVIAQQPWASRPRTVDEIVADQLNADLGVAIDYRYNRYALGLSYGTAFGAASAMTIDTAGGSLSYAADSQGYRAGLRVPTGSGEHILLTTLEYGTPSEHTLLCEAYVEAAAIGYFMVLGQDANGPRIQIRTDDSGNPTVEVIDNTNAVVFSGGIAINAVNRFVRIGLSCKADHFIFCVNGRQTVVDYGGSLPTSLTRIKLGHANGTVSQAVVIKRMGLLPVALTSAQLAARLL